MHEEYVRVSAVKYSYFAYKVYDLQQCDGMGVPATDCIKDYTVRLLHCDCSN